MPDTMNAPTFIRSCTATFTALAALLAAPVYAAPDDLPDPTSGAYCQLAQRTLANTAMEGNITVFDNMPEYRSSKPAPEPLQIYQVVTYDETRPIAVSCKVKAADHLRAVYGEEAAGEQQICSVMTNMALAQTIRELEAEGSAGAAAAARAFIIDDNEPYLTGQSYLTEFELSYLDENGKVHIQSPGLQTNWENLLVWILPDRLRGQTYCHLATVPYMKALATGEIEPGTLITTEDDAPTKPPGS